MEITNYGYFERTQGEPSSYIFYQNAEGQDWYDMQRGDEDGVPKLVELGPMGAFISSIHPVWCTVTAQGMVTNVEIDPSRIVPDNKTVLGIDHAGLADVQPGMLFQAGVLLPAPPPEPEPYSISKTTPWLRMTDDEAELITGAMQQANARQKAIYDAATYLSSGDPLWTALHDMIALALNSETRATELLAPET